MLTQLRRQLMDIMLTMSPARKPALRRSDEPEYLFATDLPKLISQSGLDAVRQQLLDRNWKTQLRNGWMLADHPIECAIRSDGCLNAGGELAAVISLLQRHPSDTVEPETIRSIAKAADQGEKKLEALCADLHERYAAMLRMHEPLPRDVLSALLAALNHLRKE